MKLKINIEGEFINLAPDRANSLIQKFVDLMNDGLGTQDFKDLNEIIQFTERDFVITEIEFPTIDRSIDLELLDRQTSTITIRMF